MHPVCTGVRMSCVETPEAVFQMNDTHPTIAVAETMRLLVDVEGLTWEHAWSISTKVGSRMRSSGEVCHVMRGSPTVCGLWCNASFRSHVLSLSL